MCISIPKRNIAPCRYICYIYPRQVVTRSERIRINRSYTVGNSDTCQSTAIIECSITNRSYTVAYYHARQATAIIERRITNRSYAGTYLHARQATTIIECTVRNVSAYYCYFL